MTIAVKKCTFADLEGDEQFPALVKEYAAESGMLGLPPPGEKLAAYPMIADSGMFHIFGAYLGAKLVGFIALLLPVLPHYGVMIAVSESFFVAQEYRKTGAGLKLLRAAEHYAQGAGSPALLVSAPSGGRLADVLAGLGYRETNRVYMRSFAHG